MHSEVYSRFSIPIINLMFCFIRFAISCMSHNFSLMCNRTTNKRSLLPIKQSYYDPGAPIPSLRRVYLYYEASLIKYSKVQQQQRTLMSIFCNSQALQKQATTPKQPELNNKCKIDIQFPQGVKNRILWAVKKVN